MVAIFRPASSASVTVQTTTVWTCTSTRNKKPSTSDWRLLYAFLNFEEALESPDYGDWIWELEIELPPHTETGYCFSSGEGDEALPDEWGVHPYKNWIMYSPNLIRRCRLVSAPGCQ